MRLFLDECLSPRIAQALNAEGVHVVLHPRDFGGLGAPDHDVLSRCVDRDLVLVTQNARDFRTLVAVQDIHPGLVILPCVGRARSETLLRAVIDYLSGLGDPMNVMVNRVVEISVDADVTMSMLPVDENRS
ncbi:MAG: DUF5615 family PIN-like protein [Rhodospirillaceae bacterium]|nr:DUF5615 family PIN-like protein [Rhodospirillaceae bacterium]MDE0363153.1 DUF5615 family PIN-like protein [Rhodospirillaceae bacterium]